MKVYTFSPDADEVQREVYKNFPKGHWLSDPKNVDHLLQWNTFFRRNLERVAIDYFQINLYPYQEMILHEMGVSSENTILASRNTAKTFMTALFSCCYCVTHPYGEVLISASTKGQANIMINTKINNELRHLSPALDKEILEIKNNNDTCQCKFRNNAIITVVVASENSRGNRSTVLIREEYRQLKASVDDSVLAPFQHPRQAPYIHKHPYDTMIEEELKESIKHSSDDNTVAKSGLLEQPTDIYISSSWIDTKSKDEFIWRIADNTIANMAKGRDSTFLAFDESIVLKHGLKTIEFMENAKRKTDPMVWQTEYLNLRVRENTAAFFTYNTLNKNRTLAQVWYPRLDLDVINHRKNPYQIAKQQEEIRIISCDLAFVEGAKNDNSIYLCMRCLPDVMEVNDAENGDTIRHGYHKLVPYLEHHNGMSALNQAVRIRQLFEDFQADYLICDARSAGVAIIQNLSNRLYDKLRGQEYDGLGIMNDEKLDRYSTPSSRKVIYAMTASKKSNSDMAYDLRRALNEGEIELPIPFADAETAILAKNKDYIGAIEGETQAFYERPFLEAQQLVSEMTQLVYTMDMAQNVMIHETGTNRKDRFSALLYANFFADIVLPTLIGGGSSHEYQCLAN